MIFDAPWARARHAVLANTLPRKYYLLTAQLAISDEGEAGLHV